ncbi:phage tail tape measure protein [Rouxiella badensis]|uniref:phage tail tape measure protein n=1 Tax=Rouxiella badensis TaxID=1646377 RepID=UPI0013EF01D8|nr:phage tail tape measure protein [Rouxiella badensis]QII37354.1 phage tail tape measure protein [Rouxiella badensis]
MSNSLKLQVLLKAVDQASRPFKAIQNATKALSGDIRGTQENLKALNAQAAKIDGFRKTSAQLAVTTQALKKAKEETAALAIEIRNDENPSKAQVRLLESAKRATAELQTKQNGLRLSVQQQREALNQAGISTKKLSSEQQRLKASTDTANSSLVRQKQELANLAAKQEQLNRVSERYRKGQELSGKVRGAGAAGIGMATVGAMAEVAVLKPGFKFAQKNSTLQATLGLEKQSPEMQALRTQARQIGDNTAASADDAASAQNIIAKGGGDVKAIMAATPVTLNMSLANERSMEDNASLLMSSKNAFGLANEQVAHLGDVISTTLNKTATNFEGLSDALTYIAPVAKNAGVSVEQTAAMIGALADKGITGSMAGTGTRAMLMRLQAPTGQAFTALKELGVKTSDGKGNMRPMFTILKEMKKSFDKNKLGTAQQAEYMKTIFGEEAAASAAILLDDARSGKLDNLTNTLQHSDGSTAKIVKVQQDNLGGDFKEFQSAYEAIGIDLFDQQSDSLRKLTKDVTGFLLKIDGWIKANPTLAGGLAKAATAGLILVGAIGALGLVAWPLITGFNLLMAGAGMLGTALSVAGGTIATVFGTITFPIVAAVALIIGAVLIIRKYWEPISAFFGGVMDGIKASFSPVVAAMSPFADQFGWLADKVKAAWSWFKELISPVQSTKEALDSCRDSGKFFGEILGFVLRAPLDTLNQLREGIDWVLDKLGLIDSKSNGLADKIPKNGEPGGAAWGGGAYPMSPGEQMPFAFGGGVTYSPVTAGAGGGYSDRSQTTNHYQITITPGMSKDDALALMAQDRQRQDRERAARQRSQMGND